MSPALNEIVPAVLASGAEAAAEGGHEGLCKLALVAVFLPLIGFVIQAFLGRHIPPRSRQGDWVPTAFIFGSLGISLYLFAQMMAAPHGIEPQTWYPELGMGWISLGSGESGGFVLNFGVHLDNLTIVMLVVVTVVSSLVHLYSWGYMHGEARYSRFFAYLALFSFSMLGLCVTSNLLFLFIFWELVGVCSYFLIGFYFEKRSAQEACFKAFITTRIGDLGLLVAVLIIASKVGSLEFRDIFASVEAGAWALPLLTFTGICLFLGPVGKSAQFPLHIWLPDAMEGPTPVSALIHAATMVAAGVYLVGRMFPLLAGAPYFEGVFWESDALLVIAVVGAFTAFFAATIAFAQTDIKKVLAYSTVSQLGYMMLGVGVGSVTAGLFHLTTHAFFKALLFLCAGSVIHAVHSNEITDMGGLRRKMPTTWLTFLIATLAISGLPFLSGFYSKEGILAAALGYGKYHGTMLSLVPFILGTVTAGMTAFYMFRLYFTVFHGEPRNAHAFEHAHESPRTMTIPLTVLAVLAVIAGGTLLPGFGPGWFQARVASQEILPPTAHAEVVEEFEHLVHGGEPLVLALSLGLFVIGVGLSSLFFAPKGPFYRTQMIPPGGVLRGIHTCLRNLWYVDAVLTGASKRLTVLLSRGVGRFDLGVIDGIVNAWGTACRAVTAVVGFLDVWVVDGSVRGLGAVSLWLGLRARRLQTGYLREYVTASILLLFGILVVATWLLLWTSSGGSS